MKRLKQKAGYWYFLLTHELQHQLEKTRFYTWQQYFEGHIEMVHLHWNCSEITSDPMNGCPGDFAEDYGHRIARLENKLDSMEHKIPKWFRAFTMRRAGQVSLERETQYHQLPWICEEY